MVSFCVSCLYFLFVFFSGLLLLSLWFWFPLHRIGQLMWMQIPRGGSLSHWFLGCVKHLPLSRGTQARTTWEKQHVQQPHVWLLCACKERRPTADRRRHEVTEASRAAALSVQSNLKSSVLILLAEASRAFPTDCPDLIKRLTVLKKAKHADYTCHVHENAEVLTVQGNGF